MLNRMWANVKSLALVVVIANSPGVFADAAKNHGKAPTHEYEKSSPIEYWQSYAQSYTEGIHRFIEGDYEYKIKKIQPPTKNFRSGYAFLHEGRLYFEDRGTFAKYQRSNNGKYKKVKLPDYRGYKASGYEFSFDIKEGVYSACSLSGNRECKSISVKTGTFPYVYASKGDAVISITNYGDALLFNGSAWCRMSMKDDVYSCPATEAPPLSEPLKIQFYSSIVYQGKVLVGEWPSGRLYEFDGAELKPSDMTPPKIAELSEQRLGYEAQTMAEYCGDLFVGYWPKGEVWQYDHLAREWRYFKRFFSAVDGEPFIPYANREEDNLDSAFFGQRVTAMVPFEDSLYVTTSNLRSWKSSDAAPATIDPAKVAEYGAIYKVTRHGCRSSYGTAKQSRN